MIPSSKFRVRYLSVFVVPILWGLRGNESVPVAFPPSNPALAVPPSSAWQFPFLLQADPFSRFSKCLNDPVGLSDRAGVGRWRAAEFSGDPVSPSDCG